MNIMELNQKMERLADALKGMQKCLDCAICYDTLSVPVRTNCGHLFCRECIIKLVNRKGRSSCPLCKANLTRRSFSNDQYIEMCIVQAEKLVSAISKDSGFSDFGHVVRPQHTRESFSTTDTHTGLNAQPSTSGTVMSNTDSKKAKVISARGKSKAKYSKSNTKSLQSTASKSQESNTAVNNEKKIEAWLEDLKYARKGNDNSNCSDLRKASTYKMDLSSDSQVMEISSDTEVEEPCSPKSASNDSTGNIRKNKNAEKALTTDISEDHIPTKEHMNYKTVHERVHAKSSSHKNQVINTTHVTRTNSSGAIRRNDSSSVSDCTTVITNTMPLSTTKETWRCVKAFGKEMRTKKNKLKSLDVSIENTGSLKSTDRLLHQKTSTLSRIKTDIKTSNTDTYNTPKKKDTETAMMEISTASETSETLEKTVLNRGNHSEALTGFSNVKVISPETKDTNKNVINSSSTTDNESEPDKVKDTSFIMTEDGEMLHIRSLNDCQMQDIIGVTHEQGTQIHQNSNKSTRDEKNYPVRKNDDFIEENPHEREEYEMCPENNTIQRTSSSLPRYNSTKSSEIGPISPIAQEKIDQIRVASSPKLQNSQLSPPKLSPMYTEGDQELSMKKSIKLSLKKNSTHSSSGSVSPISRKSSLLSSVKRNLTAEMLKTDSLMTSNQIELNQENNQSKFCKSSVGVKCSIEEVHDIHKTENQRNIIPSKKNTENPNLSGAGIKNVDKCNALFSGAHSLNPRSFVSFKKLGRINKDRHTRTKFLYAGHVICERASKILCKIEKRETHYQNLPSFDDDDLVTWIPETIKLNAMPPKSQDTHKFFAINESRNVSPKNTSTESGIYDETTFLRKVEQENTEQPVQQPVFPMNFNSNSQESVDVIFVSLDKANTNKQSQEPGVSTENQSMTRQEKDVPEGPVCKSVKVKLLSPTKDSQLKFLSFESPICDHPKDSKIAAISKAQDVPDTLCRSNSADSKTLSLAKGANSQALLRRSQESCKQIITEKETVASKEIPEEIASESSESSSVFVIKNKNRSHPFSQENSDTIKITTINNAEDCPANVYPVRSESPRSSSSSQIKCTHRSKLPTNRICSLSDEPDFLNSNVPLGPDSISLRNTENTQKTSSYGKVDKLSKRASQRKTKESDLGQMNEVPKKKYKRIVRAACSDSDSTDDFPLSEDNKMSNLPVERSCSKDKASAINTSKASLQSTHSKSFSKVSEPWPAKRKRASSGDSSSDEVDIDAIVKQWCQDLPTAQRLSKKSKMSTSGSANLDKSKNKSSVSKSTPPKENRQTVRKSLDPFFKESSSMDFNCSGLDKTLSNENVAHVEDELPRENRDIRDEVINNIIGRVRMMQNVEVNPVADKSHTSTPTRTSNWKDEDLMEDNFDDALANVDTQALANDLSRKAECPLRTSFSELKTGKVKSEETSEKLMTEETPGSIPESPGKTTPPHNSPVAARPTSSSSDKENEFGYSRSKGKISSYTNDATKSTRCLREIEESQLPRKHVFDSPDKRRITSKTNEMHSNVGNDYLLQKDTSSLEQDSLMNVTQYSRMLREVEEDILGPVKSSTVAMQANELTEKKVEDSPRTPSQKNRDLDRTRDECTDQCIGEDDIIQSTPEVNMKKVFNSRTSLTTNRGSPSTPLATNNKDTEHSPVHEYPHTPQTMRMIIPLYQSTPNVLDAARTDDTLTNPAKMVFVCSKLVGKEIEGVKELARICNGTYTTQFTADVTHVIVKANEKNAMDRTLKCLQGIAHGKWIVAYEWVLESLKKRCPVNEEPYEVIDNLTSEPSPRASRLRKRGLFEDFAFLCKGPYIDVTVAQCQDVLRATGATIVETPKDLVSVKNRLKPIVLCSDDDHNVPVEWCRKVGLAPLIDSYIFDCIGRYKLLPFASYTIGLEPFELAGHFPAFLLVDENESDSDATL